MRQAGASDADAVAAVWLRSRHASVPHIPAPVHTDEEVAEWFRAVVLPSRETWVIERDATVVAMLVLEPGWIDQLYVDPAATGSGLGSRLMGVAKAANLGGLDLWTFQANTGARRFYERHGFIAGATTNGDNEEAAPDVLYHWSS